MKSKKELIEDLSQSIQRAGTLNVLHTNAIASQIGLSATEFESMDTISHNQPMSAGQLASRCGLTTGAITGIVDRLERAGVVSRESDPKDRRRVLLKPIEDREKSKKIRKLYQPMTEAFEVVMMEYTPEQIELLIDVHNKMNDVTEDIIVNMRKKQ
jgi:DNA-binding MarR family transcriptional regulator